VNRNHCSIRMWGLFSATLLLVLIGLTVVQAQPRMRSAKKRVAMLKEQLALSDSQVTAITAILEESQANMKAAVDSVRGDRQLMRDKRAKVMKETDAKILAVLTEEQQNKYAVMKKEHPRRSETRNKKMDY
jgi:hypothetical protein